MSQSSQVAPRPAAAPVAGASSAAQPAASSQPPASQPRTGAPASRSLLRGTPGQMRVYGAGVVAFSLLFGALAALNLWGNTTAIERAASSTAQVVRVQGIVADLLLADATATNAFLRGGEESPQQRAVYDDAVDRATKAIADASSAEPADREVLANLNASVVSYTQLMEQARAYNRQGLPVGAQYLRLASAGLRADSMPLLGAVRDANTSRSTDELARVGATLWLVIGGLLALGFFVTAGLWLAQRTHRYLNIPLTAGAVGILAAMAAAITVVGAVGGRAETVRDGQLYGALTIATARASAFDARANESLTLVSRGSGAAFERAFAASSTTVVDSLALVDERGLGAGQALSDSWDGYLAKHADIREQDDAGNWDAAVALSTATGDDTASAYLQTFTDQAATDIETLSSEATTELDGSRSVLFITLGASALVAVASAFAGYRGFAQRIEEYR